MKHWQKKLLFWTLFFLFCLVGPLAILYSQGYRFDLQTRQIKKTGGLFIKAVPKGVEIFLNGKFYKKTDNIFGSTLIQNLFPKKYELEIKKEGYFTWKKNIEIKPKEVTEIKNLILFPKNLSFNNLESGVLNFWNCPQEKNLIIQQQNPNGWEIKLLDPEKNLKVHLLQEKDFSKGTSTISNLFCKEDKKLILQVQVQNKSEMFLVDYSHSPIEIKNYQNNDQFLATFLNKNNIFYLTKEGYLLKNGQTLNAKALPLNDYKSFSLEILDDFVFVIAKKENDLNDLFFLTQDNIFEKIFENFKNIQISPDKEKLAISTPFEIWVLFFKKSPIEKRFLLRIGEEIQSLYWLNNDYLVFNTQNSLRVTEIDNKDRVNIAEWALENEKMVFSGKKIYILNNKLLSFSSGF